VGTLRQKRGGSRATLPNETLQARRSPTLDRCRQDLHKRARREVLEEGWGRGQGSGRCRETSRRRVNGDIHVRRESGEHREGSSMREDGSPVPAGDGTSRSWIEGEPT